MKFLYITLCQHASMNIRFDFFSLNWRGGGQFNRYSFPPLGQFLKFMAGFRITLCQILPSSD